MEKLREIAHSFAVIGFLILTVLGIFLYAGFFVRDNDAGNAPAAVQGRLDLRQWNLIDDGAVDVLGEWEFYWGQLLTTEDLSSPNLRQSRTYQSLPGVWDTYILDGQPAPGHGYATYRLVVYTDEKPNALSLDIPIIATAYKLMIDGETVAEGGKVGVTAEDTHAAYVPQTITFHPSTDEFEIVLQMANYFYPSGGLWETIRLGMPEHITSSRLTETAIEMAMFGGMMMIGGYQLVLYLFRRRDRSSLFLGLLCLLLALRLPSIRDFALLDSSLRLDIRMVTWYEYFSYYAGITIATLYRRELFPQYFSSRFVRPLVWIGVGFMLSTVIFSAEVYTYWIDWFHAVAVVSIAYQMYGIVAAAWHKTEGVWPHLIGSAVLLIATVHDLLFLQDPLTYAGAGRAIAPFGLTALILMEALALARRFSNAYQTIETMKDRLLLLDKQKDEFLANTSHELKTPLHGVLNLSQSLLEQGSERLTPAQREHLNTIVIVSRRLSDLVNDILDFTRLKNSGIVLERRDIDAEAILMANQQVFQHYIGTKPVQLTLHLPRELPLVYADENRLLQIFYNLIGNAIKYTEAGDVTVTAQTEGNKVRFSVSDTGNGIPIEKQEQIFHSFEQVGTAVAKEYGGVGLGLGITKKLIELHGGTITVHSTPGAGSTFSFTIPAGKAKKYAAYSLPHSSPATRALPRTGPAFSEISSTSPISSNNVYRILVVDDDPVNVQVIASALMNEPYQLLPAHSGREALSRLSQYDRMDLVILDVMMPGMSGYDTCAAIRERYSLTELPILLTTVKHDPEDMMRGFAAGANDFLTKPFQTHELRARVQTLLIMKRSAEDAIASEIAFLQAQIKPHFLYNALNTILSFSLDEPERTYQLLLRLSSYLRGSFTFDQRDQMVPLAKELELTEAYLYIEQARFEARLHIQIIHESQVECNIPLLVLQPVVENAVRHGVTKKKHGGTVTIRIGRTEEFAIISVEDDGVGIPSERLETLLTVSYSATGIGLINIHKRLLRLYGHGLEINSKSGIGTKVTIRIPVESTTVAAIMREELG